MASGPEYSSAYPVPVLEESRIPRGCFYGCLIAFASGIALFVCAGFGSYWFITNQVQAYTSATPVDLPSVEYTQEQFTELDQRLNTFGEAFERGETPETDLVLTADEVNALIWREEQLRNRVYVRIEEGRLRGDVSFPTDNIPGGKGRFFNASVTLDVELQDGELLITFVDAEVNGVNVPQDVIDSMAEQNLAEEFNKDPETRELLSRFEHVAVEENQIVLKMSHEEDSER